VPLVEGAFVRALFPTNEKPSEPGLMHICYCLGATETKALVAYTTSQPLPAGLPLPIGVRVFGEAAATQLNQRPFVLYLNRVARLPITRRWFPYLDTPTLGVVGMAGARLREDLLATWVALAKRRSELLRVLGP
jgi:hypothetical protein